MNPILGVNPDGYCSLSAAPVCKEKRSVTVSRYTDRPRRRRSDRGLHLLRPHVGCHSRRERKAS